MGNPLKRRVGPVGKRLTWSHHDRRQKHWVSGDLFWVVGSNFIPI